MRIVILDAYVANPGDLSWDSFKEFGDLEVYERTSSDKVIERAKDAEVIYTNKTVITADMLKQLPKLKFIGVLATGYNVVDTATAKELGIIVSNVPAYSTASVAQAVYALILELCIHTQKHDDAVHNCEWANCIDFSFTKTPIIEISGKTLGIIGFGQIGQAVCNIAEAFSMNVIAYSRTKTDQSHRKNFRWVDLNEVMELSDFITLHCPLTEETANIINKDSINRMKKSAFLINTSRGPLIAEKDLAQALNTGQIAGAALDVLSTEPPKPDNPLLTAKNCIITPHIAWATKEARTRLINISVQNLKAFAEGSPINVVNK